MSTDNELSESTPVSHDEMHRATTEQPAHETEEKPRRSRRKKAEETQADATQEAVAEQAHADLAEGEIAPQNREFIKRFGFWRDNEAGVRLEEDRQNKLHTIISREPLPAKAVELLEERGWERDREGGGYSRKINHLRGAESREQAEQTVLAVANVVRGELGLEEHASFFISRRA